MIWNFLPYFSPLPFLLSNLFLHLNWASSSSSKGSPLWHFSSSLCPLGKNKASFLEGIPKLIASSSLQSHLLASPFLPFLDLDWASSSSNKGIFVLCVTTRLLFLSGFLEGIPQLPSSSSLHLHIHPLHSDLVASPSYWNFDLSFIPWTRSTI